MNEEQPDEKSFEVLKVLYQECERNPQLSLIGIPEKILGKKAGERFGFIYSQVHDLENFGFVARIGKNIPGSGKNIIITQKGRDYVESVMKKITESNAGTKIGKYVTPKKILVGIFIAVIAGLIVAYVTGQWRP